MGIGLGLSYFLCFLFFLLSGIFGAIQSEAAAYGSIAFYIIGRSFGALWPPLLHYLFPAEHFGFIFGAMVLLAVCAKGMNILLFNYITKYQSYCFASILIGLLSSFILLFCIVIAMKVRITYSDREYERLEDETLEDETLDELLSES